MKSLAVLCIVAIIAGPAAVAHGAVPDDAGRNWKTNADGYRRGFAAGGADMVAVLDAEFRHYGADAVPRDTRTASECLGRVGTPSVLRGSVDALVRYFVLPVPHGPNDYFVVAGHVRAVLLNFCDRSVPAGRNAPGVDFARRAPDALRIGSVNAGGNLWRGVSAFVTIAEWDPSAATDFRTGYVVGAANMLRHVASRLAERPAGEVRQRVQAARECVGSKYTHISALQRRLDTEVNTDVKAGHSFTVASTLYVMLLNCP